MARLTASQKWRRLLPWLRQEFPPRCKVRVRCRRIKREKDHGWTNLYGNPKRFEVIIQSNRQLALRVDTIIHEWAHVITWSGNDTDDHGEEWGLAYARIYREFIKWDYGRPPQGSDSSEA